MQNLRELKPLDAKLAAKRLHTALKDRKIDLTHGQCLDLVARQLGQRDWNVLSAALSAAAPPAALIEAPPGWTVGGFMLSSFIGGVDTEERHRGRPVFWLRNIEGEDGHVTVYQTVLAGHYVGKRVRFSGWLRTENVGSIASMALGACDGKKQYLKMTSLEALREGALRGTTDWSYRALVLDIPEETHSLYYAFMLSRTGEARFSGLELQVVGQDVPVTNPPQELETPNLDFSR